jgi:hypothetical protein
MGAENDNDDNGDDNNDNDGARTGSATTLSGLSMDRSPTSGTE